jgi:hypothetical protein
LPIRRADRAWPDRVALTRGAQWIGGDTPAGVEETGRGGQLLERWSREEEIGIEVGCLVLFCCYQFALYFSLPGLLPYVSWGKLLISM